VKNLKIVNMLFRPKAAPSKRYIR